MSQEFTPLEYKVMALLLAGDDATLEVLREQFKRAMVQSREMTGAGFFTKLYVPDGTGRLDRNRSFKIGDVGATIGKLKHGAGFLLYVENGAISMLEGYSYDEPWPGEVGDFAVHYLNGPNRDMHGLRKAIEVPRD